MGSISLKKTISGKGRSIREQERTYESSKETSKLACGHFYSFITGVDINNFALCVCVCVLCMHV